MTIEIADRRCESLVRPLGVETLAPRLSWNVSTRERGFRQEAYHVQVASDPAALDAGPDLWDSGKVASGQSILVPYAGDPLGSRRRCFWRVRVWDHEGQESDWSPVDWWEMGLLDETDWRAQWIGRPDGCLGSWFGKVLPGPLFRQAFRLAAPVRQARAYICGLGYYEFLLNGRKVGDHVLDPIVTQYDQHVRYVTYDVTEHLRAGENAAGVMLGNGWYNCHTPEVWHFDKASWRDYPKLLLQIEATLEDGSQVVVCSDPTWKVADGPIQFDGLRNGETWDARSERPGWAAPGHDDHDWKQALVVPGPGGLLQAQISPPCKVIESISPVSVKEVRPGVAVYDLGQNIAGWSQLRVSGPAGTEVTLRHAERLAGDGDIDQERIKPFIKEGDCQTDRYILKGEGEEVWEPHFTYHGFQYVQATGLPDKPSLDNLRGRVVHTAFEPTGSFACSNELLNRIQECTLWAYRGNFVGIPTDCPHREKNGWTGDAQLATETGLLNFDAAAAYRHWLDTIADTQRPSGQFPGIVPSSGWGYNWGSGPAWDNAFVLIPWYLYQYTGDQEVLERHYDGIKLYVDFCTQMATDHIASFGLGDWCHPDNTRAAPAALTSTAYYGVDARITAQIANLLGKTGDAERYGRLAEDIRASFNRKFGLADGRYAGGEQTSQGCALYQGMVEEADRSRVVERLLEAIEQNDGRLDVGILGAKYVPRALADAGHTELAYSLLTRTDYPSWGHWLGQGATTLWEDWRGASSRNHIMFGDISAWMYTYLAGIAPEAPGFQRILIHPRPVGDLTWVTAEHCSPYGLIRSAWRRSGTEFTLDVTIPANTSARVVLPTNEVGTVMTDDQPLTEARDFTISPTDSGLAIEVGSGTFRLGVRNHRPEESAQPR